jgi:hypothetical protein
VKAAIEAHKHPVVHMPCLRIMYIMLNVRREVQGGPVSIELTTI